MDCIVVKTVLIFCLIGFSSEQSETVVSGFIGDVDSFTNWLRSVILKNLQDGGILERVDDSTTVHETVTTATNDVQKGTTMDLFPSTVTSEEITTVRPHKTTPHLTTAKITQTTTTSTAKPRVTTTTRRPTTTRRQIKTTPIPPTTTSNIPPTVPDPKTTAGNNNIVIPSSTDTISSVLSGIKVTCTEEYRQIPGHTMCMDDNPSVTVTGVTESDKLMLLRLHNEYRSKVEPPATDLVKLKWDDRLATVAQKWANQCTMGHDSKRDIPDIGMNIGQNVAGGYRSWAATMQAWHDEVSIYKFGREPDSYLGAGGLLKIGHYTQIVQNVTHLVGCGYASCPGTFFTRYFVCDYAAGQSNVAYPYTVGSRCSSCPESCRNGLCDCGGMVCYNGGTLDKNTCTCQCPQLYAGNLCEHLNCPDQDDWVCGRDWPTHYCDSYYNVRWVCPYMCGTCKRGAPTGSSSNTTTNSAEFVSSFGCRYTGKRSTPDECRNYGEYGQDSQVCSSHGGHLGCTECSRYFNVKRDYCPVMCGMCDPPCQGKVCANDGTLDSHTCVCSCKKPYSGDTCEKAECPASDLPHCRWWPESYCNSYVNVPEDCPYKCGICR